MKVLQHKEVFATYLQLLVVSIIWKTRNYLEILGEITLISHLDMKYRLFWTSYARSADPIVLTVAKLIHTCWGPNSIFWMVHDAQKGLLPKSINLGFSEESVFWFLLCWALTHSSKAWIGHLFQRRTLSSLVAWGMCCIKRLQNVCSPTKLPDTFSTCK